MPFDEEAELVARLRTGDDDAYETLFRTHAGAMLAVARKFLGDTDDAAEAVQDAFVSAFKAMRAFEGNSRLRTWLHRITVNSCLMKLRGRRRSRFVPLDDHLAPGGACDDAMSLAEVRERVRSGMEQLPAAYREVIRLRDLEGLDTEATATRLGTSAGVVKTRLHRARTALRTLLEPVFGTTEN
jgi:RNA polymerase sigma-70 factor (ECF subfamily)